MTNEAVWGKRRRQRGVGKSRRIPAGKRPKILPSEHPGSPKIPGRELLPGPLRSKKTPKLIGGRDPKTSGMERSEGVAFSWGDHAHAFIFIYPPLSGPKRSFSRNFWGHRKGDSAARCRLRVGFYFWGGAGFGGTPERFMAPPRPQKGEFCPPNLPN